MGGLGESGGVKRGLLDLYWTLFAPLVRHQIWFQTPYNSPTGQCLQGGITDPFLDRNSFPRTSKRCSGQRSVQRSFIRDSGGPHTVNSKQHMIFHQVKSSFIRFIVLAWNRRWPLDGAAPYEEREAKCPIPLSGTY